MDALEFAMRMEKEGEAFYRDLAEKSTTKGFKAIFNMLADDEVKHYDTFMNLKSKNSPLGQTQILKEAKTIFAKMIADDSIFNQNSSQLHLYQQALENEKKSREFYLQKAGESNEEDLKNILLNIADEEEKHYFLIHNLVELLLRPQTWVENGEFVHLEEY